MRFSIKKERNPSSLKIVTPFISYNFGKKGNNETSKYDDENDKDLLEEQRNIGVKEQNKLFDFQLDSFSSRLQEEDSKLPKDQKRWWLPFPSLIKEEVQIISSKIESFGLIFGFTISFWQLICLFILTLCSHLMIKSMINN